MTKWTTFRGEEKNLEEMDHQHLSNCVWFHKIFWPERSVEMFLEQINKRFNGQLLEYRPHHSNREEIAELKEKGMLHFRKPGIVDIYLKNTRIGAIISPNAYDRIMQNSYEDG